MPPRNFDEFDMYMSLNERIISLLPEEEPELIHYLDEQDELRNQREMEEAELQEIEAGIQQFEARRQQVERTMEQNSQLRNEIQQLQQMRQQLAQGDDLSTIEGRIRRLEDEGRELRTQLAREDEESDDEDEIESQFDEYDFVPGYAYATDYNEDGNAIGSHYEPNEMSGGGPNFYYDECEDEYEDDGTNEPNVMHDKIMLLIRTVPFNLIHLDINPEDDDMHVSLIRVAYQNFGGINFVSELIEEYGRTMNETVYNRLMETALLCYEGGFEDPLYKYLEKNKEEVINGRQQVNERSETERIN